MSTAKIVNPDKIQATLSFTKTLSDWKQIKKTLESNRCYTELQVINEIIDLTNKLEKTFYSDVATPD